MSANLSQIKQRLISLITELHNHNTYDLEKVELAYNVFQTIEMYPIILLYPRFRACVIQKILDINQFHQSQEMKSSYPFFYIIERLTTCMTNIANISTIIESSQLAENRAENLQMG